MTSAAAETAAAAAAAAEATAAAAAAAAAAEVPLATGWLEAEAQEAVAIVEGPMTLLAKAAT